MSHRPTKLMAVSIKLGADTVAAAGQGVTDLRQRKSEWGANIPLRGLQRPDAWGCPTSDAGPACSPRSPAAPIRQRYTCDLGWRWLEVGGPRIGVKITNYLNRVICWCWLRS